MSPQEREVSLEVAGREDRKHRVVRQFDKRGRDLLGTPAGRRPGKRDFRKTVGERFLALEEAVRVFAGRRGCDSFHS